MRNIFVIRNFRISTNAVVANHATTGILLALMLALSVIIQVPESVVEIAYADADKVAYRNWLISEVDSLKQISATNRGTSRQFFRHQQCDVESRD